MIATLITVSMLSAAPPDSADGLFAEGRRLLKAGKTEEACAAFEKSLALDAALGTLLNLADCNEKRSRLAEARTQFLEAADRAKTAGNAEREQVARARASALADRLARAEREKSAGTAPAPAGAPVAEPGPSAPPAVVASPAPELPLGPLPQSKPAPAPSRVGPVVTIAAGAALIAAGAGGLIYSVTTYTRFQRQQPGQPDAFKGDVSRGQFDMLRWLYPGSIAAAAVGAAALTVGAVWLGASSPAPRRVSVGVIATADGIFVPISGTF
ncbi:MAG: tetratricopeptide repeat protein [Archangiaceae bacterium]|nr:tetratricopeptide repeat protein [Archangiaceae bacterium]